MVGEKFREQMIHSGVLLIESRGKGTWKDGDKVLGECVRRDSLPVFCRTLSWPPILYLARRYLVVNDGPVLILV